MFNTCSTCDRSLHIHIKPCFTFHWLLIDLRKPCAVFPPWFLALTCTLIFHCYSEFDTGHVNSIFCLDGVFWWRHVGSADIIWIVYMHTAQLVGFFTLLFMVSSTNQQKSPHFWTWISTGFWLSANIETNNDVFHYVNQSMHGCKWAGILVGYSFLLAMSTA